MKLRRKAEEHIQPVLSYLEAEGIDWQIERGTKHPCITVAINGRKVSWYFCQTSSDRHSALNFRSQVKRSVERHRQLRSGEAP